MSSLSVFLLIIGCVKLSLVSSLSKQNETETIGWQSDPDGRGTFTLVSSCVFTLVICVYSAMHLNVPPHDESAVQFWWRNIRWALAGIFGPELVVFIAWKQYLSARAIVKRSQKGSRMTPMGVSTIGQVDKYRIECSETHGAPSAPWTVVHGFYAGMGGFMFPASILGTSRSTNVFGSDCQRLTLTARGVALLADCDLLPDIERKYLDDKSKSDGLSKFIACVQAAWLIVQVIGRLTMNLQITLLEINTLGHVLCALIIYILWWHKPRMVMEPTALQGDWAISLCAYMYMSSRISGQTTGQTSIKSELSSLAYFPGQMCSQPAVGVEKYSNSTAIQSTFKKQESTLTSITPLSPSSNEQVATISDITSGSFGILPELSDPGRHPRETRNWRNDDEKEDSSEGHLLHWCMAAEAIRKYPAVRQRFQLGTYTDADGKKIDYLQEVEPEELVEHHCSNWSTKGLVPGHFGLIMGITLWFASMAFGGIHAAAWYDYFPSEVESWLWRVSAIYITCSGLLWLLINLIAQMSKPFDDYWNQIRLPHAPFVNSIPLVIICVICGALYTFARMYLVIEAFVSIRRLPKTAYQTPDWALLIPHL